MKQVEYSDEELLEEMARVAGKVRDDLSRLQRPLSEKDEENSRYWLERRKPHLKSLCAEYLRRQGSDDTRS